jgi:DNA-binding response OmpR family regulator
VNLTEQAVEGAGQAVNSPVKRKRILIVEDDPEISHLLHIHLRDLAFGVDIVNNGIDGLNRACNHDYQLIVLDLTLPGLDGIEVCRRLRDQSNNTPVLMLTARSTEMDRVLGLETGADDYLTKPFSIMELQARVKAIFRRMDSMMMQNAEHEQDLIEVLSMRIDVSRRQVTIDDTSIELTAREFELLLHFARNPGRVYSRGQLLDKVWGYSHDGYEHTVNSHINRLRKKIDPDPQQCRFIETVWGVGYRFMEPTADS